MTTKTENRAENKTTTKAKKTKIIKVNTDNKTIEIKINKSAWNKLIVSIIEYVAIFITIIAIILIPLYIIAMVEAWSISGIPLIVVTCCFVWLILIGTYIYKVNKK